MRSTFDSSTVRLFDRGRVITLLVVAGAVVIVLALILLALPCAAQETPRSVTLVAGGDVIFDRQTSLGPRRVGGDDPFARIAEPLRAADLALVNLETPLCDASIQAADPDDWDGVRMSSPPERAAILAEAGIDLATVANNHALDCGLEGLAATLQSLRAAGLRPVGADPEDDPGGPVIVETGGVRIGIWAISLIPPTRPLRTLEADATVPPVGRLPARIGQARQAGRLDLAVVSVHWGRELSPFPTADQMGLAHALIDAGADLVVGHHPHVIQPIERYGAGLVAYSLGNLLFDMTPPETHRAALLEVRFAPDAGGVWTWDHLVIHPIVAEPVTFAPVLATASDADAVLEGLSIPYPSLSRSSPGPQEIPGRAR